MPTCVFYPSAAEFSLFRIQPRCRSRGSCARWWRGTGPRWVSSAKRGLYVYQHVCVSWTKCDWVLWIGYQGWVGLMHVQNRFACHLCVGYNCVSMHVLTTFACCLRAIISCLSCYAQPLLWPRWRTHVCMYDMIGPRKMHMHSRPSYLHVLGLSMVNARLMCKLVLFPLPPQTPLLII